MKSLLLFLAMPFMGLAQDHKLSVELSSNLPRKASTVTVAYNWQLNGVIAGAGAGVSHYEGETVSTTIPVFIQLGYELPNDRMVRPIIMWTVSGYCFKAMASNTLGLGLSTSFGLQAMVQGKYTAGWDRASTPPNGIYLMVGYRIALN